MQSCSIFGTKDLVVKYHFNSIAPIFVSSVSNELNSDHLPVGFDYRSWKLAIDEKASLVVPIWRFESPLDGPVILADDA